MEIDKAELREPLKLTLKQIIEAYKCLTNTGLGDCDNCRYWRNSHCREEAVYEDTLNALQLFERYL